MITTLTGKNSYLLHRKLQELAAEFIKKYGELAIEKIEVDEIEAQALIEAVQAIPFLAERKLVVIRDLSLNSTASEQIEQILDAVSDSTDVVFYEPSIDRRSRLFKELKSKTDFQEFAELDARSLPKWLTDEAKKQGAELSFSDANYLVERLGADQLLLANEMDKLITYSSTQTLPQSQKGANKNVQGEVNGKVLVGKPKITRQTIDLLTEPTPQSRIFDLLDAAFKQDKQRALKLYEEQRAQKVEPQAILAMLAWQLRLLTIAKYKGQRSDSEVSKDFGVSEYPLRKASDLVRNFDESKLKTMVREALEIDVKAKTSAMDLDEALKTYIVSL